MELAEAKKQKKNIKIKILKMVFKLKANLRIMTEEHSLGYSFILL